MPDDLPEPSQAVSVPERKVSISRIVLLALLAVAVGLLAVDRMRGRIPRDRAYNRLAEEMGPEENEGSKLKPAPPEHAIGKQYEFWTMEKVHGLLNREPDQSDEKPDPNHVDSIVTETYLFPGAFKSYFLLVVYEKRAHGAVGAPKTMMKDVQRRG
jgi:hypothetical protein